MRQIAWILILVGAGIYLYENQTGQLLFPSVEDALPKSVNLDIIFLLTGVGVMAFGHRG
jgi:hypothetical protein